jgi:hypothetical protein
MVHPAAGPGFIEVLVGDGFLVDARRRRCPISMDPARAKVCAIRHSHSVTAVTTELSCRGGVWRRYVDVHHLMVASEAGDPDRATPISISVRPATNSRPPGIDLISGLFRSL